MKFSLLLSFVATVVLCVISASAQQSPTAFTTIEETRAFVKVERVGDPNRSFFVFSTSDRNYTIRNDGYAESFSNTVLRRFFNLKMGQNSNLERVYFLEHEADLILLYEVGDRQFGWGYLARLDQVKRQFRWITPINGYNIGPALVEHGSVYFSSANVLGRVDLRSGNYVWQQVEFEKKYSPTFIEFRLPLFDANKVLFEEAAVDGRTLEIDKSSGAIVTLHERPVRPAFVPSKIPIRRP